MSNEVMDHGKGFGFRMAHPIGRRTRRLLRGRTIRGSRIATHMHENMVVSRAVLCLTWLPNASGAPGTFDTATCQKSLCMLCNLNHGTGFFAVRVSCVDEIDRGFISSPYSRTPSSALTKRNHAAMVTSTSTPASMLMMICFTTSVGAFKLGKFVSMDEQG